jgi:phage terminase large subunit
MDTSNLSREQMIDLASLLEEKSRRSRSIVVGIFEPSEDGPRHVKSIKKKNGEWIDTDDKYQSTLSLAMLPALLSEKRFVIIIGGRGSGKSQGEASIVVIDMYDSAIKTACFREFQNSIEDSVYSLLESQITNMGLTGFSLINNSIKAANGAEAKFKGLARNPDSVKSMDGFKRFWVEEAQASSENSLKLLTPTMREEGGQIVFTANPSSSEDPFSKRFISPFSNLLEATGVYEDDLHLVMMVNWRDNPWFPEALNQERVWDHENLPRALYDHIWEGKFNDSIDNALIMAEWFDACIDAHKKLGFAGQGSKMAAHDPSDTGPDSKGFAARHGSVITHVLEKTTGDINEGGDWATGLCIDLGIDNYTWDCDGMGVGLSRQTSEAFNNKPITLSMFKGSESVDHPHDVYSPVFKKEIEQQKTNRDVFKNKRAQYYQTLRDRIYNTFRAVVHGEYKDPDTLISFDSSIELINKLRAELCRMPVKPNANGLIELYTKSVMKSRFKVDSPNLGDSVMMLMREPVIIAPMTLNFESEF